MRAYGVSDAPLRSRTRTRRDLIRDLLTSTGVVTLPGAQLPTSALQANALAGEITVAFEDTGQLLATVAREAVTRIETTHPSARVSIQRPPAGNYALQLYLALNSGRAPDVFHLTGLGIGELSASGFLEPLDQFLGSWEGWEQYPELIRNALSYNGQIWALPYLVGVHFLYYRKDILERAGLSREWLPANPGDILFAARQIKANVPEVIPYALYAGANGGTETALSGFLPLLSAFGGTFFDEQHRWIIDSCPIRDALGHYQTAYQIDGTVPQFVMTDVNPPSTLRKAFGDRELGILFDGSSVYGQWESNDHDDTRTNVGFLLHPSSDGGPPLTIGVLGDMWYINARSKFKELAWAFVAEMNSKEAQIALNLGEYHVPARSDAAGDPAFEVSPFISAMISSLQSIRISGPDPAYRSLLGVVQNATGAVATGDATPEEAVTRYAQELARILGPERVVSLPCR